MNEKIEVPTMKVPPLKKICMTIGQLPASYVESMSYYEMLVWFIHYLRDDIIPVVNANGEATKELQELYVELQEYVNNYFDNLDVQEEINNKLDAMVEDGTLQEIITAYLNSKALFCFDNVSSMKNSTNLINGSYAKTLGYYSKNDGGAAIYKIRTITNDDVIDESFILEMTNDNTLIAELIIENEEVNSIQVGCKTGDDTFDNGVKFNILLNKANSDGFNVKILSGDYYVSTQIVINEKLYAITIDGLNPKSNENGTRLIYTGTGYCLTLAKGGLKYTIKNIAITCNNSNSGINCEGVSNTTINFKNYLTNITISSAIIGMRVVSTTYTFIDNYTFGGSSNTEVGLQIEGYEFTYINNCSIDGYSYTNATSIGLKITGGINIYINNMDICNFGQGKAIYMTNNTHNLYSIYYNNINIIRCDGGIVTECGTNGYINSISFDNILISLSGTNDNSHYFYQIQNSYSIQNVSITNLTIRNLNSTNIPDYVYEHATGAPVGLRLEIKDYYYCPISKCGIKGGTADQYVYKNYKLRQSGMKYITTDGTTSSYTIEIDYPNFTNIPFINLYVVNHNDYKILNPSYNTATGKLSTQINFDTPPAAGNIRVGYTISESGSGQ